MKRPLVSTVSAHVSERLVFNFAVDPAVMRRQIPCDWLEPQLVGGSAIASFCVLWLKRVTPKGWPSMFMPSQASCAIRFGVVDKSTGGCGVFVVDRYTDSAMGSLATRVGCPGFHPLIQMKDSGGHQRRIEVVRSESTFMCLDVGGPCGHNGVFGSLEAFERFMSKGSRSYTLAASRDVFNVVDLEKEETPFEAYDTKVVRADAMQALFGDAFHLDSAFRATNARYVWTFVEQRDH